MIWSKGTCAYRRDWAGFKCFEEAKLIALDNRRWGSAAANSLQPCPTLCDPIDGSYQVPLSLGFSKQECWSRLPFLRWGSEESKYGWKSSLSKFGKGFSSVQLLSHVWLFVIQWIAAHQASLSNINSQSLPKVMSIESVMPLNHLILCCPLLLQSFPASGSFQMSLLFASLAKVLGFQLQHQSFQWTPRTDLL